MKRLRSSVRFLLLLVFSVLAVSLWLVPLATAADWSHWRGPLQNGVSYEKDLPDRWSPEGENLIWKMPYGGRSTPIVQHGRVYIINHTGEGVTEQERVMCFDAETGKVLWEHKFNVFFTDIVSDRVGWTNPVGDPETGNVYVHGVQGLLFCFDRDGKVIWSRSLTEEFGRISGYGGRITSPIIDGDLLLLGMINASWGEQAAGGNRFVAFNKRTGAVVWWSSTGHRVKDTYYSCPVVAVINGERLLISGGGDGGVHAFRVRTGEKVWSYIFGEGAVNCSPVVDGNLVYIGHGEGNPEGGQQGKVICLDASQVKDGKPKLVWERAGIKFKFASPILHEGQLIMCDEFARMYCFDAKTGNRLWFRDYGRNAKGSPVWADGKIYVGQVNGSFSILQPEGKSCKVLHTQRFISRTGKVDVEVNGSPAVANGKIYFLTSEDLYCIGKKGAAVSSAPLPSRPQEEAADPKAKPAWLQVVPADVMLQPGESATFQAYLYDAKGRLLRETKAQWSAAPALPPQPPPGVPAKPQTGPMPPPLQGEIGANGTLTVSKTVPAQFGRVVAKADGLEAYARVRVVPRLPYEQDFEKVPEGRTPPGWVNAQGKFAVQQKGDSKVLVKLATNPSPLVARANAYIAAPTLTDYTIQADVMGGKKGSDMPDVGIVANRYHLVLWGNTQQLRLTSWDALPRVDRTIAFAWKPDVWYTMKLTVEVQGNKAVARGKVWERGQPEPKNWTVEFEDPIGNREGSPALYGNATGILENEPGTEIYYDNVKVISNK
ncbi:MAG TPA: PQQ-binding-like beta-propeller repeat protein [Gemmataceae bacterium]|nr:PQQ-binding-like beta-propeller repeat protein [Gemmataceae bacterium]